MLKGYLVTVLAVLLALGVTQSGQWLSAAATVEEDPQDDPAGNADPSPGTLTVETRGLDGRRLALGHPWHRLFRLVAVEDAQGWPLDLPPGTVETPLQDSNLRHRGLDRLELSPGDYTLVFEQWLGGPVEPGSREPGFVNRLRLPINIPAGQPQEVVVAAGGLMLDSRTAAQDYTCRLRLEAQAGERWRTVLPTSRGEIGGRRRCMPLGQQMPLLPGRYRLLDEQWGEVLAPPFTIEPGILTVVEVGR